MSDPPPHDAWVIVGGPVEVFLGTEDQDAWVYMLERASSMSWEVRAEVPQGQLDPADPETNPAAAKAQTTLGRSEVERIRHLDEPPDVVRIYSTGARKWWRDNNEIEVELL